MTLREDSNDGGNESSVEDEAESVPSRKFSDEKILRQGRDSSIAHPN